MVFAGIVINVYIQPVILENNNEHFTLTAQVTNRQYISDFLAEKCQLSKIKIKDALQKGAIRLQRNSGKWRRIRKAKYIVTHGDKIIFAYSRKILEKKILPPTLLQDRTEYSIWFKPPGMLSQGTPFGDHLSLLRYIEKRFPKRPGPFLIHRLDKDVSGVIIFGHSKKHAANLTELFRKQSVTKIYLSKVAGFSGNVGTTLHIQDPIENRPASTKVEVLRVLENDQSLLRIILETGRKHQIRRHLASIDTPVVNDRLYGFRPEKRGNLLLQSYRLVFTCPVSKKEMVCTLPDHLLYDSLRV